MAMLSQWLDSIAQRFFAKDQSGRTAFFPRGRRRSGYYVDAADESRLKPLVKMYAIASALINFVGSMACLGFTEALTLDHGFFQPEKFKLALTVYAFSLVLFLIGPGLILWRVYGNVVTGLCAPLAVADPSSVRFMPTGSGYVRATLLLLGGALILLALGLLLIARRHF